MYRIILLLTAVLLAPASFIFAQEVVRGHELQGHYDAVFIRGNAVMHLDMDIYPSDTGLVLAYEFPSWVYYGAYETALVQEGFNLRAETFFGEMKLHWDSLHAEIVGNIGTHIPAMQVHLKKMLKPAVPEVSGRDLTFSVNGLKLKGRIYAPSRSGKEPLACAVFVHGRGCGSLTQMEGRARKLAEYGLATVTFDKRGAKNTGFDCEATTMDLHADDLSNILQQTAKLPEVDPAKIGFIGYSAGGWVAPAASRRGKIKPAFMVTVVGPSTSVRQQQLDCSEEYVKNTLKLDEKALAEALEYTELMFLEDKPRKVYDRMQELLKAGEAHGWLDVLEQSDIPTGPEALEKLWVRRNRYDPAKDLAAFKGPFLSILGEKDDVVPWENNLNGFQKIFGEAGKTNYRIRVIPEAGHGMENGTKVRQLPYSKALGTRPSYTKFDRVVPGAFQEIVDFLQKYGFTSPGK